MMTFKFKFKFFKKHIQKSSKQVDSHDTTNYEEENEENFDKTFRKEYHNKELSNEEKDDILIEYDSAFQRMECENEQMFNFIKIKIEKEINRSLTLEEIRQIRDEFSKRDKNIYDNIMSIVE